MQQKKIYSLRKIGKIVGSAVIGIIGVLPMSLTPVLAQEVTNDQSVAEVARTNNNAVSATYNVQLVDSKTNEVLQSFTIKTQPTPETVITHDDSKYKLIQTNQDGENITFVYEKAKQSTEFYLAAPYTVVLGKLDTLITQAPEYLPGDTFGINPAQSVKYYKLANFWGTSMDSPFGKILGVYGYDEEKNAETLMYWYRAVWGSYEPSELAEMAKGLSSKGPSTTITADAIEAPLDLVDKPTVTNNTLVLGVTNSKNVLAMEYDQTGGTQRILPIDSYVGMRSLEQMREAFVTRYNDEHQTTYAASDVIIKERGLQPILFETNYFFEGSKSENIYNISGHKTHSDTEESLESGDYPISSPPVLYGDKITLSIGDTTKNVYTNIYLRHTDKSGVGTFENITKSLGSELLPFKDRLAVHKIGKTLVNRDFKYVLEHDPSLSYLYTTGTYDSKKLDDIHFTLVFSSNRSHEIPQEDIPVNKAETLYTTRHLDENGRELFDTEMSFAEPKPGVFKVGDIEYTLDKTTESNDVRIHTYKVVTHEIPQEDIPVNKVETLYTTRHLDENGRELFIADSDSIGLNGQLIKVGNKYYRFTGRVEEVGNTRLYYYVEATLPNPQLTPSPNQVVVFDSSNNELPNTGSQQNSPIILLGAVLATTTGVLVLKTKHKI